MSNDKEIDPDFEDDIDDAALDGDDTDYDSGQDDAAGDLADEDWDSYDDDTADGDDDAAPAPAKKKNSSFNMIVIGVVMVGGLGFVALKMGGGGQPAPVSAEQAAAQPQAAVPNPGAQPTPIDMIYGRTDTQLTAKAPDAVPEAAGRQGLFNDPKAMDELENVQRAVSKMPPEEDATAEQPPQPPAMGQAEAEAAREPAPGADVLTPMPEITAEPAPDAAAFPDATAADAETAATEQSVSAGLPKASDIILKATPAPVEPVAAAPVAVQADVSALAGRLDRIASRLESIEARLNAADGDAARRKQDTQDLRAALDTLKTRLDTMPAAEAAQKAPAKKAPVKETRDSDAQDNAAPARAVKPAAKPAAHKAEAPRQTAPASAPVETTSVTWVLKSALPGQAMIARKGGSEVLSVAVGNTLPGLGTITSIAVENGRWVVRGSKGSISQ